MTRGMRMLLLAVAITVGWIGYRLSRPDAPAYQGRSVEAWINELARTRPQQVWENAERPAKEALRTLGVSAVPYLARAMEYRGWLAEGYGKMWPSIPGPLRERVPPPVYPGSVRIEAARMLEELVLRHPNRVLENGVSAFRKALQSPDGELRRVAVLSLGALYAKHPTSEVLLAMIAGLDSAYVEVRTDMAIQFALRSGPEALAALPALRRGLGSVSVEERIHAAAAMYRVSDQPEEPVAALTAALLSEEATSRGNAAAYLAKIGPAAKSALPALRRALEDPEEYVRHWALQAVKGIDPASAGSGSGVGHESLEVLVARATNPASPAFQEALESLEAQGPAAKEAVPALVAALDRQRTGKGDIDYSHALARTLLRIDPSQADLVIVAMTESLRIPGRGNRNLNAAVLGEMGATARQAVPALWMSLKDPDPSVRVESAYALLRIGTDSESAGKEALQVLIRGLEPARSTPERYLAIQRLGRLGSAAADALNALLGCLEEGDPDLKRLASESVRAIDPDLASRKGL